MTKPFADLRVFTGAEALMDHWLTLRGPHESCPHKKDFSPMALGRFLPDIFLTEWVDDTTVMIRVAGSRTSEIVGCDATGRNLFDVCLKEHVASMREFFRRMRSGTVAGVTQNPLPHMDVPSMAKALFLPLLGNKGETRYFVGAARSLPLSKCQEDFRQGGHDAHVSLDVWFQDISNPGPALNVGTA